MGAQGHGEGTRRTVAGRLRRGRRAAALWATAALWFAGPVAAAQAADLSADGAPSRPEGLRLVTPLDRTPDSGAADSPCATSAVTPLAGCLSLGGGLDRAPAAMGVGLSYGLDGWLSVGLGLGLAPGLHAPSGGAAVASAAPVSAFSPATERLGGSLTALVDLNAATGLDLWGFRSYLGAGLAAGQVSTPRGLYRDGAGAAVAVAPSTGLGVAWGAAAGTNLSLGDGLSLDFAVRYTDQRADGPLAQGPAFGLGAGPGGIAAGDSEGGEHGMSLGLRLRF